MKTYVIIAAIGLLIFGGGFYLLYYAFSKDTGKPLKEAAIVEQLDDAGKAQFKTMNNSEFEEEATPLNDEAMSKL